ncbi:tetratricopeptide repeat protein [Pseudoalteromonas sp. ZZD1]|uniref:tetratricopeptide repeat protein n=1 Tax=Pseudoalteromonas sp. ZZD1 TaxID=3139395 RepID=UPI003BAA32E6
MSVINSMLKNIEQRQPTTLLNEQGTVVVEPVYDSHGLIKKLLIITIALLVVVLSYIYLPTASDDAAAQLPERIDVVTKAQSSKEAEQNNTPVLINAPVVSNSDVIKPVAKVEPIIEEVVTVKTDTKEPVVAEKPMVAAVAIEPSKVPTANKESSFQVKKVTQQRTEQQQIAELLRQAKQALEFGLYQEGIDDLSQILNRDKGNIAARSLLAATYFQQQDILSAQSILEHGIAFDSQVLEWRVLLSKIYITRKQYSVVQQLLSDDFDSQGDSQYWALKGTAAQQLGDHTRALVCFEQLTQLQPQQGKWWLAMATSKDAQGDYLSAKRYYLAAIEVGNLNPAVLKHAEQRLQALGGVS